MRESSLENIDYKNKIQNILYDNYIKLALVNLDTGKYVSIINVDGNADDYDNIEDVSSYFAKTEDWNAAILMRLGSSHICVI